MAESAPTIELLLGDAGTKFDRWTNVSLNMRLDTLSDGFELTHIDRKNPTAPPAADVADAINEGDHVRVTANGETLIDGFVDKVSLRIDLAQGPTVSVSGRSRTADLSDCAALHFAPPTAKQIQDAVKILKAATPQPMSVIQAALKASRVLDKDLSGEWRDVLFGDVAEQICAPFGIEVVMGDGAAGPAQLAELAKRAALPFRRVSIDSGETAADFLSKLAKERGLTLVATPDGDLAYTLAGIRKIVGALQEGRNIGEGGGRTGDSRDRFSHYRVIGQSAGDDAWHGEAARGGDATATDDQVTRYRPWVGVSDGTASDGDFQSRADYERNRRAARARTVSCPVLSWLSPEGTAWLPNRLVDVSWPALRVEGELLIEAVSLTYGPGGDTGTLDLVSPGAYDPLQAPKTRRNRRLWASWA